MLEQVAVEVEGVVKEEVMEAEVLKEDQVGFRFRGLAILKLILPRF